MSTKKLCPTLFSVEAGAPEVTRRQLRNPHGPQARDNHVQKIYPAGDSVSQQPKQFSQFRSATTSSTAPKPLA